MQQFTKNKRRPLPELIEELTEKVVEAAARLQANLCSAATSTVEQPASRSTEQPASVDSTAPADPSEDQRLSTESSAACALDPDPDSENPRSLVECSDWLKAWPAQTVAQCEPLRRLQSAIALLQSRSSREQRQKVQQLLGSWDVSQKTKSRKRKFDELKADLIAEIVEETRRLKTMQDAYEPQSLRASATTAGACFSAIQTAL